MTESILVPQVGQDLTDAKLVVLHVKLGDLVKKGDIVAEVESEKATFEVEAFASGTVVHLPYKLGDVATVLQPLVILAQPGEEYKIPESTTGPVGNESGESEHPSGTEPSTTTRLDQQLLTPGGRFRSSPLARRLAAINGLEVTKLKGTGPKSAVVMRDVETALENKSTTSDAGQLKKIDPDASAKSNISGKIAIRSLKRGNGDPIIFIHGFGAELATWRPFVEQLSIPNSMYGVDLPSHGASSKQEIDGFESIVEKIADALIAAGHIRVHLVGHSLGAAVAASLQNEKSIDVRSLTLISPAGLGPKINGEFLTGFLSAATEPALKAWMQNLVHAKENLPVAMVRATFAARKETDNVTGQSHLATLLFSGSTQLFSIRKTLNHYNGPCRVIFGNEDEIIPAEQANDLPGHVAINKLVGIGHLPYLESATLVARLVTETVRAAG